MKKVNLFLSITAGLICVISILICEICVSQNVGINIANLDPSALLELTSDSMGFLIPRMTTDQRNAIDVSVSPNSVMIFNTTTKCFEFYYDGSWYELGCATDTFTCGSPFTDVRDGQSYSTVWIAGASQCWMAENLNYGTYVAVVTGGQDAANTQKYCQNLSGVNDATCPMGGLYEWAEMMDGITTNNTNAATCNGTPPPPDANVRCSPLVQGICPAGWHVPSHYEWTLLEKNVGTASGAFPYDGATTGWLGTDEGGNMKVTPICGTLPCWNTPNTGATNSSGFTALPGGRSGSGSFTNVGNVGYWWSATESGASNAWFRTLYLTEASVYRADFSKLYGFSVRCVQD